MIALLALLIPLQDPRVDELIHALGDDMVEARDKAAAEIFALGESARPALEKARRETAATEVRTRVGDILGRLDREKRRLEFKGGPVVGGLCASIRVTRDAKTGETVLTTQIKNVGTVKREVAAILSWDTHEPARSISYSSSQAKMSLKALSQPLLTSRSFSSSASGPPACEVVPLQPGESRTFEYRFPEGRPAAGEYEVQATYYAKTKGLVGGATEDLKTGVERVALDK